MQEERNQFVQKTVKTGISFGSALAMVISYTTWHSIGWAIFHGLLSWLYVIYFLDCSYLMAAQKAVSNEAAFCLYENHFSSSLLN